MTAMSSSSPTADTALPVLLVPGWRNSGPTHWQNLWASRLPQARRVVQDDWVTPACAAWVERLEREILACDTPVILVAHSLGCITSVALPPKTSARVRSALLVAPADPERRGQLADFAPVPCHPLPYRSLVVASDNDPYCPVRLAAAYARAWGSDFVKLNGAGHINVDSGHGDWPLGWGLLCGLLAETRKARREEINSLADPTHPPSE
jgi:uncharacterized protein